MSRPSSTSALAARAGTKATGGAGITARAAPSPSMKGDCEMAKGGYPMGQGFPEGTCPDSDHIAQERSRLRGAAQRHFAQNSQQAAPPKGKQTKTPPPPPQDIEDAM